MYSISEGFKEAVQNKKISAVRSRFFTLIARRPSGNEIQAYVTYCLTHGIGEDELYMPDSGETFSQLKTEWTPAYWTDLGSEMQMKFSKKRITHMIEVANYLFPEQLQDNAKKIRRLCTVPTVSKKNNPIPAEKNKYRNNHRNHRRRSSLHLARLIVQEQMIAAA